jgi:hypothetical protein
MFTSSPPKTPLARAIVAMMPLAFSLATQIVSAQTMKVSGESNTKEMYWRCSPLPTPGALSKPITAQRNTPPVRTEKGTPATSQRAKPAANASWKMLAGRSLEYCVTAGVVNDGASASGAPLTLTLSDIRGSKDHSYTEEFPLAERSSATSSDPLINARGNTVVGPPTHTPQPNRVGILSQPVPANSAAAVGQTWCTTLDDWRKRPRLMLTLTGSGVAEPISCGVEFGERSGGGGKQSQPETTKTP